MRLSRPWFAFVALAVLAGAPARVARAEDPPPSVPDVDETRGYIGYAPAFVQSFEEKDRKEMGITKTAGLCIVRVTPKSPADLAGLKRGDVIQKIKGQDVTDAEKVDGKSDDAQTAWLKGAFKSITSSIKPGEEVEMVVDRGGTAVTAKPIAIALEEMNRLTEAARDDENAVTIAEADGQGAPREAAWDFEKIPEDAVRPAELLAVTGFWEGAPDESSEQGNHVLRQSSDMGSGFATVLAVGKGLSTVDGTSSVRFQLMDGERSVSAGIVVRARDRKNWIGVIADGVTKKLELIAVVDLVPTVLASTELGSPKLKAWHTLEVKVAGTTIEAVFDGTTKVAAKNLPLKATGWNGLLTRGDADTAFDDWKLVPVTGK